jgi:hypothetical protein
MKLPVLIIVAAWTLGLTPSSFASVEGKRLTLSQFLEEVRSKNLDLAVEKANVDAAEARASGIRINPPMVGYMQMKEQGRTNPGYEISQEIPFPTKITQDKKVRNLELEAQKESSNYQQASIVASARTAYVAFWNAYSRLELLKEKRDWLHHHVKLTRTTSWSDTAAKIHLLEVESDADLAENEVLALESELLEKRNALKVFAPDLKSENIVPIEPPIVSIQVEKSSSGPEIAWKEKELQAREAFVGMKKQSYLPDFFVRLRSFNGNEMSLQSQELMVGVSLPFLFFWQPRAEVAEASAQKIKAEAELQKSRIEFESKLSSLTKRAQSIEAQVKNLKDRLIPRAERRTKLVRNLSTRTMEGLDQHKSVVLGLLDLKTKAVDLRLDHENIISEIVKLTGDTLRVGAK